VADCLHFIDVDGIPVGCSDKLSPFYQAVSSLILHNEVIVNAFPSVLWRCRLGDRHPAWMLVCWWWCVRKSLALKILVSAAD